MKFLVGAFTGVSTGVGLIVLVAILMGHYGDDERQKGYNEACKDKEIEYLKEKLETQKES